MLHNSYSQTYVCRSTLPVSRFSSKVSSNSISTGEPAMLPLMRYSIAPVSLLTMRSLVTSCKHNYQHFEWHCVPMLIPVSMQISCMLTIIPTTASYIGLQIACVAQVAYHFWILHSSSQVRLPLVLLQSLRRSEFVLYITKSLAEGWP